MERYNSKQYDEQIILVTKGWGFSKLWEEIKTIDKINKIKRIFAKRIKVPEIDDISFYNLMYSLTKEYISEYRFNNIYEVEIPKLCCQREMIGIYDIINLMMIELSLLEVSENLKLEPIDEILSL